MNWVLAQSGVNGVDCVGAVPTTGIQTPIKTFEEICFQNKVALRRIRLDADWWRTSGESLIGYAEEGSDRQFVLISPTNSGYQVVFRDAPPAMITEMSAGLLSAVYSLHASLEQTAANGASLMYHLLRGLRRELLQLSGLSVLVALCMVPIPYILAKPSSLHYIEQRRLLLLLLCFVCLFAVISVARSLVVARLRLRANLLLQTKLWGFVVHQDLSFFRSFLPEDIMHSGLGVDRIERLLDSSVIGAMMDCFIAAGYLGGLYLISPELTMWIGGAYLSGIVAITLLAKREASAIRTERRLLNEEDFLSRHLVEGVTQLQLVGAQQEAARLWTLSHEYLGRAQLHSTRLSAGYARIADVMDLSLGLVMATQFYGPASLRLSVLAFTSFLIVNYQMNLTFRRAAGVVPAITAGYDVWRDVRKMLAYPVAARGSGTVQGVVSCIAFRNVTAGYEGDASIVESVSFSASRGQLIAFVGPSGSGKSTCLRLILGLIKQISGSIHINGKEVSTLNMPLLRRRFGVVLQGSRPHAGSIFEVIAGGQELTLDEAWELLSEVGLREEVERMPLGLFTPVNPATATLSGGQLQRMMIARALASRPEVLILDEATSALDNVSQSIITEYLKRFAGMKIVVAHRLTTIWDADMVHVLEKGRIIAAGTATELMLSCETFRDMVTAQL